MKPHIVFDLETAPDESVPFVPKAKFEGHACQSQDPFWSASIELRDPNPFAPPACHTIVCCGYATFEDHIPRLLKTVNADNEEELTRAFLTYANALKATLVGWNTRRFDVPVLVHRALKYAIPIPWYYEGRNRRYRYADPDAHEAHVDVMDQMSDFGAAPNTSLEQAARLLGLPGKPGVDGGSVAEMMKDGKLEDVKAYCLTDVLQEAIVWLRWEHIRGAISRDIHEAAVLGLRDLADPKKFPAGFLEQIDWRAVALAKGPEPVIEMKADS